jgi:hypothetical protein
VVKSRLWSGVLVVLMGVAGLLIALSSNFRTNPMWQVWAALAVTLCGSSGLVALHGLAQWRELAAIRPLRRASTILPTAVILSGTLMVIVTGELVAAHPGGNWRGDLLVLLAVSGGACTGAAMFGVRRLVTTQPETIDLAGLEMSVVELVGLRRRLQRLASGLGALVALSTLALGAGILMAKKRADEQQGSGEGRSRPPAPINDDLSPRGEQSSSIAEQRMPPAGATGQRGPRHRVLHGDHVRVVLFQVGDELAEQFLRAVQCGAQRAAHSQVVGQGVAQRAHAAASDPGQGRAIPRSEARSTFA